MAIRNQPCHPDLELRVTIDGELVLGPIQAKLLEAIRTTGSISAAHRKLGISYAHVWKMVAALNELFSPPLVDSIRGGARGGGAVLTQQGHKILNSYRRLEELSQELARTQLLVIRRAISQRDKCLEN
jgi:molybdate transport system regulatory protein